jgi:cytochrome P450
LWNGSTAWIVTRYADVQRVLLDSRFSAVANRPGYPAVSAARTVANIQEASFIHMDAPEHYMHRRLVSKAFQRGNILKLRPKIERIVEDLLDGMLRKNPPVDFVTEFALALPSRVICEILGVPYGDRDFFHERASVPLSNAPIEEAQQAQDDLRSYLDALIDQKLERASDDLLSELAHGPMQEGLVTKDGLVSMAFLLLVAGHETTAKMLSLGTLVLLQHPDQLEELRAAEPALLRNAVEELLRYLTIAQFVPARVALTDVEIGGVTIHSGEGVFALAASADRDEARFTAPDLVDIHRSPLDHLAFGHGIHICLGQHLARLELEIAFGALFRKIPSLSLAVAEAGLRFDSDSTVVGLQSLPLTWERP